MGVVLNPTEETGLPEHFTPRLAEQSADWVRDRHVDCAIVVVTYNSARDILPLLGSLAAAVGKLTTRVIIVDNASTDGTVQVVKDKHPSVTCVAVDGNLGYAAGINVGRKFVGDRSALLVLNPDIVLEPSAIEIMMAALDDPKIGVVVPMLLDADGRRRPSLRRAPTLTRALGEALLGDQLGFRPGWLSEIVRAEADYETRHPADWATGAVLLISAACNRLLGQWDERFFLYCEEVDYASRVRAAGLRIEYVPEARARHRGAGSGRSNTLTALNAVNRIRYMEKLNQHRRAYRAVVILHELLRASDAGHRTALAAVLRRSTWPRLIATLRGQAHSSGAAPAVVSEAR